MTPEEMRDHVRRLVDTWPPLTADQRTRLAALFRPYVTADQRARISALLRDQPAPADAPPERDEAA